MKKSWKISIFLIIALGIIIIIASVFDDNKADYAIADIFEIEILGTEDYGYADISVNSSFLEKTGISLSDFSYKVSKSNMLSNDDIITITVDELRGIELDTNILEYKVSGLQKGTDLDIFKDLNISYDAESKKIVIDNSQCSEFIKENVIYSINHELDEYNSGDVVEVLGYVDMNAATDNRYNILSTTYKYIVE